jgi:hypothetical protein
MATSESSGGGVLPGEGVKDNLPGWNILDGSLGKTNLFHVISSYMEVAGKNVPASDVWIPLIDFRSFRHCESRRQG